MLRVFTPNILVTSHAGEQDPVTSSGGPISVLPTSTWRQQVREHKCPQNHQRWVNDFFLEWLSGHYVITFRSAARIDCSSQFQRAGNLLGMSRFARGRGSVGATSRGAAALTAGAMGEHAARSESLR